MHACECSWQIFSRYFDGDSEGLSRSSNEGEYCGSEDQAKLRGHIVSHSSEVATVDALMMVESITYHIFS